MKPLKNLRNLLIDCLSDSSKYFELKKEHFRLEFHNAARVNLEVRMPAFNLELKQIFARFSWKDFPINSFTITLNKLRFIDD